MKLLLDTHAFIWWDSQPNKLTQEVLALCKDPENQIVLSVASVWEMQIKLQLGKLTLGLSLQELIDGQRKANQTHILPIELHHVFALQNLPPHHKDPFDRLLIAQAITEGAVLVSHDPVFKEYAVALKW